MAFTDKERAFLIDLEQLTRKHGIAVSGCGCCGSPFLVNLSESEIAEVAGYGTNGVCDFCWIQPEDEYAWERYRLSIVRPRLIKD